MSGGHAVAAVRTGRSIRTERRSPNTHSSKSPRSTPWIDGPRVPIAFRGSISSGMKTLSIVLLLVLTACTGVPDGVTPVSGFKLERYLGKWYEIARLDHSFERGLTRVTAEYGLRDDGTVRVVNRGYLAGDGRWKEAEGTASFVGAPDLGHLKVSFFGPFYGSYIVFGLDEANYRHALVSGPDKSYLWILARTPTLDKAVLDALVARASAAGFDTGKLIFVSHD
jgi:apolipoprotein D and lipocalin family protein